MQWLKWRDWHEPATSLWYWRDQTGNEVDLVLERNDLLVPIECKLSERPAPKDTSAIHRLRRFYGPETTTNAFIACTTPTPFDLDEGITAIAGWKTWDLPG